MVLFWPFRRGEDNSPDSFERILAKLASQIQSQTTKLTGLRQRSRRYKALFTLYTVIGYILYVVVVVLVVGWKEVGRLELSGVTGGPVCIWSVRRLFDLYYNYRIGNAEGTLEELQTKQKDTIEKLKAATKYSTTQSIIERYGGGSSSACVDGKQQQPSRSQEGSTNQQLRERPQGQPVPQGPLPGAGPIGPSTPQQIQQQLLQQQMTAQQRAGLPSPAQMQRSHLGAKPGITGTGVSGRPNPGAPALNLTQTQPSPQQLIQPEEATSPKWYDRLLDLIVGEDETSAKNRYALICKNCRMVNGLAPPGIASLNDMEGWRCARCGSWNGPPPGHRKDVGSEGESGGLTPEILDGEKKAKGRRTSRSPSPSSRGYGTTRSYEDETPSEERDLEVEEVPEPPQSKSKGRGEKKA